MANKQEQVPLDFGDFLLVNHEKYGRAVDGFVGAGGENVGGVGRDATAEQILAEYDRLGGLVLKKDAGTESDDEGNLIKTNLPVATGTFYDFSKRKPRTDIVLKFAVKPNKSGARKVTVDKTDDRGVPAVGKKRKAHSPADEKDMKDSDE